MVYVAIQNDSVYALDGSNGQPLWHLTGDTVWHAWQNRTRRLIPTRSSWG